MPTEFNFANTVTIAATPTVVSQAQASGQRSLFTLINTSLTDQIITIAFGADAVDKKGIVLYPGGYYQESIENGFKPSNDLITAIMSSVSGAVTGTLSVSMRVIPTGEEKWV